jgi:hypothetical protein
VRQHPLHGHAQRAPDEPGKKRENYGEQKRALQRGWIGQSTRFDLIEEMHN